MKAYNNHTDDEMTALLRRGDDSAFTVLYDRYWELLLGIAYNRLKDLGRADLQHFCLLF